ncbi:hypothetical protein [Aminiphilus circumscriptus]|uniref:hypothetical protein n=1 Tax=Aminiphilus circumscriptus TaxID=290732 RepID=UPI00047862E9|nr:hypothetical protein [Aminiphilus circumscriptus]
MRVEAASSPWMVNEGAFPGDLRAGRSRAPEEPELTARASAAGVSAASETSPASDGEPSSREAKAALPLSLSGPQKGSEGGAMPVRADGLKALAEERAKKRLGLEPCETCENRRYQDDSDDPSVSFQAPTKLTPQAAAAAVPAHEGEHVHNEQARANREGRRVISQSVRIHTSVCPECGRVYVSGGTTTTVTASETPRKNPSVGENDVSSLDLVA